jgi:hypothetical protein
MATGSLCLMVIGGRALNPGPCHRFLDPYSVRDEGFDFYYQEETKAPRPTTVQVHDNGSRRGRGELLTR